MKSVGTYIKWRHSHPSTGQECGDLVSDSEECGYLAYHYIGTQTLATLPSLIFHFSLRQTFYADSNGGCPRPWTKLLSPVSYLVWLVYGLKTAGLE